MKITHFFILLLFFSVSLFLFLKPQDYHHASEENVAQLEIEDFTLYEISRQGVDSIVSGTVGRQYHGYYEVENAHYVENKGRLGEHLYADEGKFEKDIAYLDKNVRYFREDGLSFESDHAVYNTKDENLYVPKGFTLTLNENIIYGSELHYNVRSGKITAEMIEANYYMENQQ